MSDDRSNPNHYFPNGLPRCFSGLEFFEPVALALELHEISRHLGNQAPDPDPRDALERQTGWILSGGHGPRPPEQPVPLPPHGTEAECRQRLATLWRVMVQYARERDGLRAEVETATREMDALKRSRDTAQLAFLAETERRVALEFQVADLTKTHEAQAQAKQALADEQWRNLNEAFEARKRTQRSGGAFGAP